MYTHNLILEPILKLFFIFIIDQFAPIKGYWLKVYFFFNRITNLVDINMIFKKNVVICY